jgi:hypothetical protein
MSKCSAPSELAREEMKEERLRAVWLDSTSLDRHGAQAEAARRATLGGPAMALQAAEDLAHASKRGHHPFPGWG